MTNSPLPQLKSALLPKVKREQGVWGGVEANEEWAAEIKRLKEARNAVILAHNYQIPEIQDIADFTGDSLALSRKAAETDADVIVFCGVHFMAESAKILSPNKTVLIPDEEAGCSLADSISADELREWKAEHPEAVVVSYVNTTADVKALTDICCTSSNAVDVVKSIDPDKEVLFCPDQFLGAHVQRETGRDNIRVWAGECHVHAGINGAELAEQAKANPDADLYIHPECGCANSAIYLAGEGTIEKERVHMLSTGGMLDMAKAEGTTGSDGQAGSTGGTRDTGATGAAEGGANSSGGHNGTAVTTAPRASRTSRKVLVATEIGMLHQLRQAAPEVDFQPINDRASCVYMKMITPAALLRCLADGMDEVDVPTEVASKARASLEAMIAIGNPGSGE
ncbi:quinolinate synthase NadA [Corynebacterium auriscanis]|uniref:quinolinate synthase NadA n=1 Tax=Corynebacterium TaxID=1716 RepID=UPI0008A15987|nr:quinolinate synthase NadA [Corynebacterium sp. HMSC28B08]OFT88899.1 quinolinate synthase [Corynebacterium sp. HMSC28B08]